MRVFVTGATGFVGAAAARALRERGHAVVGLARCAASAEALVAAGVDPVPGALGDADALRSGVARADAVVHAAFPRHYLDDLDGAIAAERAATAALLAALDGTGKPFVYTSGLGVVGDTGDRTVDEDTPIEPPPHMAWRRELELDVLASGHGVVLRPPLVHGHGQGHVLEIMVRTALERGAAAYPAPGTNPWPNVHVDDLGRAFALAAEDAPTGTLPAHRRSRDDHGAAPGHRAARAADRRLDDGVPAHRRPPGARPARLAARGTVHRRGPGRRDLSPVAPAMI